MWLLGDGNDISFWNDAWCGPALSYIFNIPDSTREANKLWDWLANIIKMVFHLTSKEDV